MDVVFSWEILKMLDDEFERKRSRIHKLNANKNIIGFIEKLENDDTKFYSYSRMSGENFENLLVLVNEISTKH